MKVIVDYRASKTTFDALEFLGYTVIKTPRISYLYDAICTHTDVMLYKLDEKTVIVEPSTYEYFKEKLHGIKVVKGKTILNEKYPFDIAYNAAQVGKKLICNEKYTDRKILDYCIENDIKIINTKQGYSKCSICVISDNAIITSDKNIAIQAEKNEIEVLLVNDDKVKLRGFEHGFIGGATGLLKKDLLAVNGNINLHSDADKILNFLQNQKIQVISLNDGEITDIGSIVAMY